MKAIILVAAYVCVGGVIAGLVYGEEAKTEMEKALITVALWPVLFVVAVSMKFGAWLRSVTGVRA